MSYIPQSISQRRHADWRDCRPPARFADKGEAQCCATHAQMRARQITDTRVIESELPANARWEGFAIGGKLVWLEESPDHSP